MLNKIGAQIKAFFRKEPPCQACWTEGPKYKNRKQAYHAGFEAGIKWTQEQYNRKKIDEKEGIQP